MRLKQLESGHRLRHKLLLKIMRVLMGGRVPDVMRTALYRPEFFWQAVLGRHPSRDAFKLRMECRRVRTLCRLRIAQESMPILNRRPLTTK